MVRTPSASVRSTTRQPRSLRRTSPSTVSGSASTSASVWCGSRARFLGVSTGPARIARKYSPVLGTRQPISDTMSSR